MKPKLHVSEDELKRRSSYSEGARASPIPNSELWANLSLYSNRQAMSRLLYIHHLYQMILGVPGVIMEFGVRWGQNLALYLSFRGIYEPYNYSRKIIGFDTFAGFPETDIKDGPHVKPGDYNVSQNYDSYLQDILRLHQQDSPLSHIEKFELIKGDVLNTLDAYLNKHPETIISMAYFDLDLYKPTKECLTKIEKHLTKGSLIAFDELNCPKLPGETVALQEAWGLSRYPLKHSALNPFGAYTIIS